PVLIIIYIIKNKYTEQVITSTYLWTLSERFLKRKNPLKRITGILSLILQMLIVALIAFSVAQPTFILYGAANDYMIIIDGSASMNISSGGVSRLDRAIDKAEDIINSSVDGSSYTIVFASDITSTLCDGISDKSRALSCLEQIDEGYCSTNLTDALSVAQEKFTENPSLEIYLYTDKDYDGASSNFNLINLSSGEENYAVSDVSYELSDGKLKVTGSAWSYESDASLTVSLYIDGGAEAAASEQISAAKLNASEFSFESETVSFSYFTVAIEQGDSLPSDNECTIYSLKSDSVYNTLIVTDSAAGDNSFFLNAALTSFGDVQVTTVSFEEYAGESGYGLYIFDNCTPSTLPSDGAVWFVNPQGSVSNSGFYYQNSVTLDYHGVMEFSGESSSRVQALLEGTVQSNIYIKKYAQCGLSKTFYTLLSYNSSPLLFAGTNSYGNREVVFAFDFHDTDFALSLDYIPLMANLFNYTFPEIISETSYYCGDTIEINVLANCTSIRLDTPLGGIDYVSDMSSDVAEYTVTEAGTYTITLMIGGSERKVYIYVSVPLEERYTALSVAEDGGLYAAGDTALTVTGTDGELVTETVFFINGDKEDGSRDGSYSELWLWIAALAILFLADWGVYCYEQYQLR
ncbi:MAG: VWA domain-containing protein, partial [Clostridia bacterium]|nr:VWA domain-containing protein [Clostridia bacterium]